MTCWKTERHERPTFATLRKELSTYQRNATSDSITETATSDERRDDDPKAASERTEGTNPGDTFRQRLQSPYVPMDMTEEQRQKVQKLEQRFKGVLAPEEEKSAGIPTLPPRLPPERPGFDYKMVLKDDAKPRAMHPYRLNPKHREAMKVLVKRLTERELISPAKNNEWASPAFLSPNRMIFHAAFKAGHPGREKLR